MLSINWRDLGTGLALYFVLEGLLPFASPASVRRAFATLIAQPDRRLRLFGLLSMAFGCALLYFVRS